MSTHIAPYLPSPDGFVSLRDQTDWGAISLDVAKASLSASLSGISLYDGSNDKQNKTTDLIGMARVIGDGVLNLYIQDVIIAKAHRGHGLGAKLMTALIGQLKQDFPDSCTIGLLAAKGQAPFYARFGFNSRPSQTTDAGMNAQLGQLRGLSSL